LDEPLGDCNGDFNDKQIFECQKGAGIFLRPTAVKLLVDENKVINESAIYNMDESLISGM
jgi:dynactin complex subunit